MIPTGKKIEHFSFDFRHTLWLHSLYKKLELNTKDYDDKFWIAVLPLPQKQSDFCDRLVHKRFQIQTPLESAESAFCH